MVNDVLKELKFSSKLEAPFVTNAVEISEILSNSNCSKSCAKRRQAGFAYFSTASFDFTTPCQHQSNSESLN
jgi:hypothetical protein